MGKRKCLIRLLIVSTIFIGNLLLSACTSNTGTTPPPATSSTQTSTQQLKEKYNLPTWWRPCLHDDNAGHCDSWDMTKDPVPCDGYNYQQKTQVTPSLLTSWRGIQVCGPLPFVVSTSDNYIDFYANGSVEQEFECTELVKRYLYLAYGLKSQPAYGWQIVDTYTHLSGSPFNKVANNGSIHMAPVEGDVLSYGMSDPGHTSIVTASNVDSEGNGTISIIEQNVTKSGTAILTMSNWMIKHDANHIGTVASWMTPRNIEAVLGASTQVASSTPSPTPTDTPTPAPTTVPPTNTPTPVPPTPVPQPKVYHMGVDSSIPPPGVDTGIALTAGEQITITAQGWVTFGSGSDPTCDTSSNAANIRVNPDGQRETVNGVNCPPRMDQYISHPDSPVGELMAGIGSGTSQIWFAAGSSYTGTVSTNGNLYLLFDDGYYPDNTGQYQVTITVSPS